MFDQMKQLYQMKKKFDELQKQLQTIQIEKSNAGMAVKVNGNQRIDSIQLDATWLSPDKKDALESSLRKLLNDALEDVQKKIAKEQGADLMKDLQGFKLPGM